MRVLISTGIGRLHFVPAATALQRAGVDVTVVTGWRPWRGVLEVTRPFLFLHQRLEARWSAWGLVKNVKACGGAELFTQIFVRVFRLLRFPSGCAEAWGWRLFGWRTRRFLRGMDILHVRSGAGQGGLIKTARRAGLRVIVDHSIAHPGFLAERVRAEYVKNEGLWDLALKDCEDADRVVVNSNFVRDTFIRAGFPEEKIRVVWWGVEPVFKGARRRRCRDGGPLRVLFVGSFDARKGAGCLLRAMELMAEQGVDVTLDVVGWKGDGGSGRIRSHGVVPHETVAAFLGEADVFAFPTLAEGCARAVMEAMAAGLCVVTTRESGAPVQENETGFLVPAGDAGALAGRIEWLAANREAVDRVGAAAATLVTRRYTWEAYAAGMDQVYRELR